MSETPAMLNVHFTIDVEIWCDGWTNIDSAFPEAFRRYIYGNTRRGEFGLPLHMKILSDNGVRGTFFVEPLFAARFGLAPLQEVVGLISEAGHDIQLHMHTEWADEATEPIVPGARRKRQHLFMYTLEEQRALIAKGLALMHAAGAPSLCAFRAGSFGFNRDTMLAISQNGLRYDSSYNATMFGPESGVYPGGVATEPFAFGQVVEFPMSVFVDGIGNLRHAQISACSYQELQFALDRMSESGIGTAVLLSHSFELLTRDLKRPDRIAIRRLERIAHYLSSGTDRLATETFSSTSIGVKGTQPAPVSVPSRLTYHRMVEQLVRAL